MSVHGRRDVIELQHGSCIKTGTIRKRTYRFHRRHQHILAGDKRGVDADGELGFVRQLRRQGHGGGDVFARESTKLTITTCRPKNHNTHIVHQPCIKTRANDRACITCVQFSACLSWRTQHVQADCEQVLLHVLADGQARVPLAHFDEHTASSARWPTRASVPYRQEQPRVLLPAVHVGHVAASGVRLCIQRRTFASNAQ